MLPKLKHHFIRLKQKAKTIWNVVNAQNRVFGWYSNIFVRTRTFITTMNLYSYIFMGGAYNQTLLMHLCSIKCHLLLIIYCLHGQFLSLNWPIHRMYTFKLAQKWCIAIKYGWLQPFLGSTPSAILDKGTHLVNQSVVLDHIQ